MLRKWWDYLPVECPLPSSDKEAAKIKQQLNACIRDGANMVAEGL